MDGTQAEGTAPADEYQALVARSRAFGLWPRQLEVLRLIVEGYDNVQIAGRLTISVKTVKGHVSQILRMTGCCNRMELIVLALHYQLHDLAAAGEAIEQRRLRRLRANCAGPDWYEDGGK